MGNSKLHKKKKKVEMQQHTFEQPVCQRENKKIN